MCCVCVSINLRSAIAPFYGLAHARRCLLYFNDDDDDDEDSAELMCVSACTLASDVVKCAHDAGTNEMRCRNCAGSDTLPIVTDTHNKHDRRSIHTHTHIHYIYKPVWSRRRWRKCQPMIVHTHRPKKSNRSIYTHVVVFVRCVSVCRLFVLCTHHTLTHVFVSHERLSPPDPI